MRFPVPFLRRLRGFLRLRRLPPRARLGHRGERCAVRALRRAGYRILARNLRTPAAEVDILALDHDVLVLVEVKTSAAPSHEEWPLHDRLGHTQIRRLQSAARWLARHRTHDAARRGPARRASGPTKTRGDLVTVAFGTGRPTVRIHRAWF